MFLVFGYLAEFKHVLLYFSAVYQRPSLGISVASVFDTILEIGPTALKVIVSHFFHLRLFIKYSTWHLEKSNYDEWNKEFNAESPFDSH